MILASFASGSTGNCTFLSTGTENILIDCGLSAKRINELLGRFRAGLSNLDAVLLTHEHTDHIKGLKRIVSAFHIPVYLSCGTLNGLAAAEKENFYGFEDPGAFHIVEPDREFYIGNTLVHPFHSYHDTAGPLGYRFEMEQEIIGKDLNVAVLTDCGKYDGYIEENLKNLDALLIESNHDVDMLMNGPYPMNLKRRILSESGHASNENCYRLINSVWSPRLKDVLLAHLSEENNTPELAYETVRAHVSAEETEISVAPKNELSRIIRY